MAAHDTLQKLWLHGDHPDGAEPLVAKVRAALGARFRGESLPRTVFVDRGVGFYSAGTGGITPEFKAAPLRTTGSNRSWVTMHPSSQAPCGR